MAPNIETESCVTFLDPSNSDHTIGQHKNSKIIQPQPALSLYHLNSGNTEREKNTHNKKNRKVKKVGGIPQCNFLCDSYWQNSSWTATGGIMYQNDAPKTKAGILSTDDSNANFKHYYSRLFLNEAQWWDKRLSKPVKRVVSWSNMFAKQNSSIYIAIILL